MKFRWKIFFLFTSLIAIIFCIFGVWMVDATFQASLTREIERGNSENQMFQFAFEMTLDSMSEEYLLNETVVIKDIADSLKKSMRGSNIRIYNKDKKVLIDSSRGKPDADFISNLKDSDSAYQIMAENNEYFLKIICRFEKNNTYYLENMIDISYIYQERESLFSNYRIAILILLTVTGIVTLLLSYYLTRSVVGLSRAAKRFSNGELQIRAKKHGNDEIGELTQDFNQMAENLSMKIEQLSLTAKRQEDFTASFAHELKTPLTSIIGYADMIRTVDMDKEETHEAVHYIYSQGKRLESLSFKLLELFSIQKNVKPFEKIDVIPLIEETKKIVSASLETKYICLGISMEEGDILGERDLLLSLFVNLVDNSRKALQENGHIWINGCKKEGTYEFYVRDDGCGIPEEEVDKITDAFYMVDKSRSRKEGGAGLGMTLCSKIVQLHKAKWYIQSRVGEGTSIWVTFKLAEEEQI